MFDPQKSKLTLPNSFPRRKSIWVSLQKEKKNNLFNNSKMPLPWKKSKVSRISRLVADLQPPNRGNSLVVETGFPTSLIDLFVKNRERFKKPSKKKKQQKDQSSLTNEEMVISNPILLSNSRDLELPPKPSYLEEKVQRLENLEVQRKTNINTIKWVSEDHNSSNLLRRTVVEDEDNELKVNEMGVLMAVLKMFVVVVLALSTRKLVVGITMSAFGLIFVEYVGKYLLICLLKPCSSVRKALDPFVRRGFCFSLFGASKDLLISKQLEGCKDSSNNGMNVRGEEEEEDGSMADSCDLFELREEIRVVETNLETAAPSRVEEIRRMEINSDFQRCDAKRWKHLVTVTMRRNSDIDENRGETSACEKEARRSSKLRAKLKQLVPKKLRGAKRWKNCKERFERDLDSSGSEVSSCRGDNKLGEGIEDADQEENGYKIDLPDTGRVVLAQLLEKADEVEAAAAAKQQIEKELYHGISTLRGRLQAMEEITKAKESLETERTGNSGYLILCFIALVGLVGGRMMALLLTVGSCLMLKLFRRKRRCANSLTNNFSASR